MNFRLVLMNNAYGFSYFQGEIDYSLSNFVNKNALNVVKEEIPIYLRVAITHTVYCLINRNKFANKHIFTGDTTKSERTCKDVTCTYPRRGKSSTLGAPPKLSKKQKPRVVISKYLI